MIFVVPRSCALMGMAPRYLLGPRLRSASGELCHCFKEKCSGQAPVRAKQHLFKKMQSAQKVVILMQKLGFYAYRIFFRHNL